MGQTWLPCVLSFNFSKTAKDIMGDKIERIKTHIEKHKVAYACTATTVIVAGITAIIMRSNIAQRGMGGGNAQRGLNNTASFIYGKNHVVNVTTVLDREGRGHPGWPVRNIETKRNFLSQVEAAKYFDVSESVLSGHLNGKFPDVNGLHFERISLGG